MDRTAQVGLEPSPTTSSPLILRRATAADIDTLAEIYLSAFTTNAYSSLVFPYTKASYDWWRESIREDMKKPNIHFLCVYDSSLPWQPVVAWSKWDEPNDPHEYESESPRWPAGSDVKLAEYFSNALANAHKRIMKGKKHWYLRMVSTRPEYQGKGAGLQLLKWITEKADADADGRQLYLEASPAGLPIYERLGFVEVDRLALELEGKGKGVLGKKEYVEVFMVRKTNRSNL